MPPWLIEEFRKEEAERNREDNRIPLYVPEPGYIQEETTKEDSKRGVEIIDI